MQTDVLIWLVAGIGLGVFLTMAAFALIVAVDRRRLRRKLRRVKAPPEADGSANKPSSPAMVAPRSSAAPEAASLAVGETSAHPAGANPAKEGELAAAAEARSPSSVPAAPVAPAPETPAEETPRVSVEEMFARAFEAAVPIAPGEKSGSDPAKP